MTDTQVLLIAALLGGAYFGGGKVVHAANVHVARPVHHAVTYVLHRKKKEPSPHAHAPESSGQ